MKSKGLKGSTRAAKMSAILRKLKGTQFMLKFLRYCLLADSNLIVICICVNQIEVEI